MDLSWNFHRLLNEQAVRFIRFRVQAPGRIILLPFEKGTFCCLVCGEQKKLP